MQRILVLQLQQVGDSLAFTPALRALRGRFPDAQIDFAVNHVSGALYAKYPFTKRLWVVPNARSNARQIVPFMRVMMAIRRRRYDLVIADVSESSLWYGTVALLTGARTRIGFDVASRGFLFTHRLVLSSGRDFLDCNLDIARAVAAPSITRNMECYFDDADQARAIPAVADRGASRPVVLLHAFSNWQSKLWFPERWSVLADRLASEYGASVILVGGPGDRAAADDIIRSCRADVRSMVGETSLTELAAIIAQCDLYIGTDSGPRHLAAAARRPQVTLMSSQDLHYRWDFGWPREILLRTDPACSPCFQSFCSHRRCMDEISVEMVVRACDTLLSSARKANA